jgi:nucleotide-binding universal stress UspA family protein
MISATSGITERWCPMSAFVPRTILAAVDADPLADGELAHRVVDVGIDVARSFGAKLVIGYAMLPVMPMPMVTMDAGAAAARAMSDVLEARAITARKALAALEQRARDAGVDAEIDVSERSEGVAQSICAIARERGADIVVVASHHRHGLARVVLGSVAAKVAELCPVPVLMVPEPSEAVGSHGLRHATP